MNFCVNAPVHDVIEDVAFNKLDAGGIVLGCGRDSARQPMLVFRQPAGFAGRE